MADFIVPLTGFVFFAGGVVIYVVSRIEFKHLSETYRDLSQAKDEHSSSRPVA